MHHHKTPEFENAEFIDRHDVDMPKIIGTDVKSINNTRHERLERLRYSLPFMPVNTLADHCFSFFLNANQSENVMLPADASLFMITSSDSGNLMLAMNGKPSLPPTLITTDSLTAGQSPNSDFLPHCVVNPVNIMFDCVGISSIGLMSLSAANLVSVWAWKSLE